MLKGDCSFKTNFDEYKPIFNILALFNHILQMLQRFMSSSDTE